MKRVGKTWTGRSVAAFLTALMALGGTSFAQEEGMPEIRGCTEIVINGDVGGDIVINTGSGTASGSRDNKTWQNVVGDFVGWLGGLFKKKPKGDPPEGDPPTEDPPTEDPPSGGEGGGEQESTAAPANAEFLAVLHTIDIAGARADTRGISLKLGPDQLGGLKITFKAQMEVPRSVLRRAGIKGKRYFKLGSYQAERGGVLRIPFSK